MTASASPNPRRYLALWFPDLPTERLLRLERRCAGQDERPRVVVRQERGAMRLVSAGLRARMLGLSAGLSLADARARVPDLDVFDDDPEADARLIGQIAEDCDRWTPLVALDAPHGLMLDITGCAHLFGGEAKLRERIMARLRRAGLTLCSAVATTPDAARAIARFGEGAVVPAGGESAVMRSLPIAALESDGETLVALRRAGFRRIGDLADQPSSPLAERFGAALGSRLQRLLGEEDRRITPLRPVPACMVEQPFAEPIGRSEDIEASLVRLIGRAAAVLEARGEGGRRFEASFFRTDGLVRRVAVMTGRPLRETQAILRLFRERLDVLADPLDPGFGFDLIRLAVPVAEPVMAVQPELDGQAREEDEVADLIDRLVARFGAQRVLRFVAGDTHDPLRAARRVPLNVKVPKPVAWPELEPGEPPSRPLHLFEPPQPIEAMAEVPDGPPIRFRWRRVLHEVARAEGPERIAPEWWRDQDVPTRDYFRVEDAQGRRFWLYRAGLYGREEGAPRWYLHGLFA